MTATRTHTLDDAPRPRRAPEQTVKVTGVPRAQHGGGQARLEPLRSAGAAVVKVTPYRKTVAETVSTLTYVLEKGKAAEDDWARDVAIPREGETGGQAYHRMHAQAEAIAWQWAIRDGDGRLAAHIVLSLPNKDPKAEWDAARDAARACFPNSPYICVLHTGKDNPHVHVVVRMRDYQGKKLRIDRDTLHEYRQALALAGRARGIAVEARRYRVPTRLRDKTHVFSTAEPLGRVLDRQIAVLDHFTESTPTMVRQACKTLARHRGDLQHRQRHKLLRVAGKLEAQPKLQPTARALTRLAFKAPSGERRPVRQRASDSPLTVVAAIPAHPELGGSATTVEVARPTSDKAMAPPTPAAPADQPAETSEPKQETTVSPFTAGVRHRARTLAEAAVESVAERAAQVSRPIRDMVQTGRLLSGVYDPRSMRGLAELASDLAAHGGSRGDATVQRGWHALRRALAQEFQGTRLGQRLAWHGTYKRERRALREELEGLQQERKALRAEWVAGRDTRQPRAELGLVSAALAENAARRKDLRRELKAQKKLRKPLARKQKQRHQVKALRTYARALRKEHKALRQQRKAQRAEYKTQRAQHSEQVKAARQELRALDRASKQALHEKRQALAGERKAQARQYKQLRRELGAGAAEVRQARQELRTLGRRHKEAMREARQAKAVQQGTARERVAVRRVELDKARCALAELTVSLKLHRHELAHLARTRKGVARNDARSLAESSRIVAALARSTTPQRLRDQAAAVREQQAAARAAYDAQRATRNTLARQYRQLPRHERSKAQRAALAALDGKLKAARAELAGLCKIGTALARREQSSLELVLRHARRENADPPRGDRPARMRGRSEKGQRLLTGVAHTRHREELRQDLAALQARRKTLRAVEAALGKDAARTEERERTRRALAELGAQVKDVRRELRAEARLAKPLAGEQAKKEHRKALRQHARELRTDYKTLRQRLRTQQQALRSTKQVLSPAERDRARKEVDELRQNVKACREEMRHANTVRRALARNIPGSLTASTRMLGATRPEAQRLRDRAATVRERETVVREQHASLREERKALAREYKAQRKQGAELEATRPGLDELGHKIKACRTELGELLELGKVHRRQEQSSLELVRRSIARGRDSRHSIDADKVLDRVLPAAQPRGHQVEPRAVGRAHASQEPTLQAPGGRQASALTEPRPPVLTGGAQRRQNAIERAIDRLAEPPTGDRHAARRALWTLATRRDELTDPQRRRIIDQVTTWRTPQAATEGRPQAEPFVERCKQVAQRIATHDDASGRIEHYLRIKENLATLQRSTIAPEAARTVEKPAITIGKDVLARKAEERATARAHAPRPVRDTTAATAASKLDHAPRAPEREREAKQATVVVDKNVIARNAHQRAEVRAHAAQHRSAAGTAREASTLTVRERAQAHLDRAIVTLGRLPDQASANERQHAAKAFERLHPHLSPSQRDALRQQAARLATDARYARLGKALERIAQAPARERTPAHRPSPAPTRTPSRDRTPLSPRR